MNIPSLLLVLFLCASVPAKAGDTHTHLPGEQIPGKNPEGAHDEREHGDHEEKNNAVGPEKGVVEFNEERGFRLSPEAEKNFEVLVKKLVPSKNGFEIPSSAILEAQAEKYVYVESSGMIKRVPIEIEKRDVERVFIKAGKLLPENRIVVSGVPYVRAAELDVTTEGGGHGH